MGRILNSETSKIAILACFIATASAAQDTETNGVSLTVSQNLNYDLDGDESNSFRALTGLQLNYGTATRANGFQFTASTGLEFGGEDSINGFLDPIVSVSYRQESKNAGITASANLRQAEVSSILGVENLVDPGFVTIDSGRQTDVNYSVGYDFGRTDPISGSITYSNNARRYAETDDATLLDFENHAVTGQVNLRFDDRIVGRVSASFTEYSEDGGLSRTSAGYGIGANLAVNQTLSVDASLNFDETERTDSGITTTTDGLGFTLAANQSLPDGSLSARLSSFVNENGRSTTVNVSRAMELRNGSLSFSLGGVRDEDGEFDPTYSIGYEQELPRGALVSIEASQTFNTSIDGVDSINTSAAATFSTPLTTVSSFQATANYRETNGLDLSEVDASRLDLGLTYQHDLAQDWGLVGGYNRSFTTEDGEADQTSDTVFVGLQKNFEWRP